MSSNSDGGPAFPLPGERMDMGGGTTLRRFGSPGMSLRDWLAGQALVGLLAITASAIDWPDPAAMARRAYAQADAMLAERQKPPSK